MYLDFQANVPVFIKTNRPVLIRGREYKRNSNLPWRELGLEYTMVRDMWLAGTVYHNEDLEKQTQVGDRLVDFEGPKLVKLVDAINAIVKAQTNSTTDYNKKRCKKSRIDEKQRGLLRSFLRNNLWIEEDFYKIRDEMLEETD